MTILWGEPTWDACDASIYPVGHAAPPDQIPAGWFPTYEVAKQWLKFVKLPDHPGTSRP